MSKFVEKKISFFSFKKIIIATVKNEHGYYYDDKQQGLFITRVKVVLLNKLMNIMIN